MLSFVQSWFAPAANPIGVDFGVDCVRLAQVEKSGEEWRLIAAASEPVPAEVQRDPAARFAFFTRALRELCSRGKFRGRRAVLALPASDVHIQHLRLPRMDDDAIKKAIPWEAQGKIPIDPAKALIRHLVAGDVYTDNEPRSEVIVMAARGEFVEQLLSASSRAGLEIMALTVEPKALVDCFLNIYRRKTDSGMTNLFIDIGRTTARAVIAHGAKILFARSISIGTGEEVQSAKCKVQSREATADPNSAPCTLAPVSLAELHSALTQELTLCRRYHESAFPDRPVQRLIFVGSGSTQRELCQDIARTGHRGG